MSVVYLPVLKSSKVSGLTAFVHIIHLSLPPRDITELVQGGPVAFTGSVGAPVFAHGMLNTLGQLRAKRRIGIGCEMK